MRWTLGVLLVLGGCTPIAAPPTITLTATELRINGALVRDLAGPDRDEFLNIPELEEALKNLGEAGESSPLAAVQAYRGAPYGLVRRVMFSCRAAGFTDISYTAL